MKKILAIDFGLEKIGLAMAEEGGVAEPFMVLKKPFLERLLEVCREKEIDQLVVGISEGEMAKKQRVFGEELSKQTDLPVFFQDETLTSRDAVDRMREAGRGKRFRSKQEDAIAAALILESFLLRC